MVVKHEISKRANEQLFDNSKSSKFKLNVGEPNDISALRANSNFKSNNLTRIEIRPNFKRFEDLVEILIKKPESPR